VAYTYAWPGSFGKPLFLRLSIALKFHLENRKRARED
jgi:hypothetical protein